MNKIYTINKDVGDHMLEPFPIGFVLTEEEAKLKVAELNKPYEAEKAVHDKCYECRRYENDDYNQENEMFRLADTCEQSSIQKDRHGDYCENDQTNQWGYINDWYFYSELEKLDQVIPTL